MMHESIEGAPAVPAAPQPTTEIGEPVAPGTSMTLLGGRPLRKYIIWFVVATLAVNTAWISMMQILLPNHVR